MNVFVFHRKARMKVATYLDVLNKLELDQNQFVNNCQFWQVLTENTLYEKAERTASNIINRFQQGGAA